MHGIAAARDGLIAAGLDFREQPVAFPARLPAPKNGTFELNRA
jgi:hypothetical protein